MEYHPALWLKNRHTSLSGVPSEEQKWCFYTTEALRSYHAPERVNERDRGVMAWLYCRTLHSSVITFVAFAWAAFSPAAPKISFTAVLASMFSPTTCSITIQIPASGSQGQLQPCNLSLSSA